MDNVYVAFNFICLLQSDVDLLLIRISWSETNVEALNRPVRDRLQCGRQTPTFRINLLSQSSEEHIWVAFKNNSLNSLPRFFLSYRHALLLCLWVCIISFFVYHVPVLGAFEKLPKATVSFVMNVRPSVRMEQLGFH